MLQQVGKMLRAHLHIKVLYSAVYTIPYPRLLCPRFILSYVPNYVALSCKNKKKLNCSIKIRRGWLILLSGQRRHGYGV